MLLLVLITYDVCTADNDGRRRLSKVAKVCVAHGQRVQNSVFECSLEPYEYVKLKNELLSIIDETQDSLRFYNLGQKYVTKIEHYGAKASYLPEEVLIL